METCSMTVIKYILFVFNLIFAISGAGIIAAGVLVLMDIGEFQHFVEWRITAPPIVLVVAGSVIFVVAFLGCYGAIKESHGTLIAFVIALVVIFVTELAVGIAAAVFKNDFGMAMRATLGDSMKNYTAMDKRAWDEVQNKFHCCGTDGPEDWTAQQGFLGSFPGSCCSEQKDTCQPTSPFVYPMGCFAILESHIKRSASILIGVGIGIAFVEIAGIVLGSCLAAAIRREGAAK